MLNHESYTLSLGALKRRSTPFREEAISTYANAKSHCLLLPPKWISGETFIYLFTEWKKVQNLTIL